MQGRDRRRALARGAGPLRSRLPLLLLAVAVLPPPARAQDQPIAIPRAYFRAPIVDGHAFPVARSNWFSVIGFRDDWHAPRMRLVGGRWVQAGVHEGIDIEAEAGTPVLAAFPGRIESLGWTFYSGNRVGVRGHDGRYWFYAHLDAYASGLRVGVRVRAGQALGRVGNTGYGPPGHEDEFPPHLHLGIRGADWQNPFPLLRAVYRASAARTARGERRLAELARAGDRDGFDRLAASLFDARLKGNILREPSG